VALDGAGARRFDTHPGLVLPDPASAHRGLVAVETEERAGAGFGHLSRHKVDDLELFGVRAEVRFSFKGVEPVAPRGEKARVLTRVENGGTRGAGNREARLRIVFDIEERLG
jgi:hypothetical protein